MYVYMIMILTLCTVGVFIFIMANAVQGIQEAFNPHLDNSSWMDNAHFTAFESAATFVNYIWLLFPAGLVLGLIYWGYVYSQRHNGGN